MTTKNLLAAVKTACIGAEAQQLSDEEFRPILHQILVDLDRKMTAREMSALCGDSEVTLYRQRKSGKGIPFVVDEHGRPYYTLRLLIQYNERLHRAALDRSG